MLSFRNGWKSNGAKPDDKLALIDKRTLDPDATPLTGEVFTGCIFLPT